jgi:hypothetical protein
LAEEKTAASPESNSKPLVEVNITGARISIKGFEKFAGVAKNLIKAISRGLGSLYEPVARVRDAKADRAVAIERMQTLIDITQKRIELTELRRRLGVDQERLQDSQIDRALSYLAEDLVRTQRNRESTIEAVAIELNSSHPERDTDAEIDDDWLTKFWKLAENISHEAIKSFFARLLVREASKPGTISPLTLNVLSTLMPQIARRFEHFCRLSIRSENDVYVIHPEVFPFQNIGPLEKFGVSLDDLYEFESFGLLRSAETIMLNFGKDEGVAPTPINYAGIPGTLNFYGHQLRLLKFTRAGAELRELLPLLPRPEYTAALKQKLKTTLVLSGAH